MPAASPETSRSSALATLVWVRGKSKSGSSDPYLPARVTGTEENGLLKVVIDAGVKRAGEVQVVTESDTFPRNPPGTRLPDDNCQLLHLNEACVLDNVAARFAQGEIYTWTSHVLTAVNPYESLPIYSDKMAAGLIGLKNARDLPPHVFSVAEQAVRSVVRGSQSVIVSGESGAGKTVSMTHVMAHLTRRARVQGSSASADGGIGNRLGTLLLQSNPVLEAFGNAQTVRNRNSSRFGKFVKIVFDPSGTRMITMLMKTYLLEKVRVVSHGPGERTYHAFYALLSGMSSSQAERFGLKGQKEHRLTAAARETDSGATEGNSAKFVQLCEALTSLSIKKEEQDAVLQLLAALVHLCDVRFAPLDESGDGGCRPIGSAALAQAVKLLGCPGISLALMQRVIVTRGEPITVALSATQAGSARDALCKVVYVAIFDHLCQKFNKTAAALSGQQPADAAKPPALSKSPSGVSSGSGNSPTGRDIALRRGGSGGSSGTIADGGPFVGLLDMFGFEIFEVNSFEQLCINLANERLQGYFQQCVFKAEEEVHRLEGVPWPADVEYHDNTGCISLITKAVFTLLDEACELQSASESTFMSRVAVTCARDPFFAAARRKRLREDEGFIVRHFAGDVCYCSAAAANRSESAAGTAAQADTHASSDTWLVKNADRLLPELDKELHSSSNPMLSRLFEDGAQPKNEKGRGRASVSRRFCADIDKLVVELSQTHARFIRCIKPNSDAAPRAMELSNVLAQLRCLGMTDMVRLMHKAFPTRIPYTTLHGRYAKGMPSVLSSLSPRDFCEAVALVCEVNPADIHLGTTRLFLRGGKGAFLEDLSEMDVSTAMPILLAKIEEMDKRRAAGRIVACATRAYYLRVTYQRSRRASALIVRIWRGALARIATRDQRDALREARLALTPKKRTNPFEDFTSDPDGSSANETAESEDAAAKYFEQQLAEYHMLATGEPSPVAAAPEPAPPPIASIQSFADEALFKTLGVQPLCAGQLRAVHALRLRLGEHLDDNTTRVANSKRTSVILPKTSDTDPEIELEIPERRRLNVSGFKVSAPTKQLSNDSSIGDSPKSRSLPLGMPPSSPNSGEIGEVQLSPEESIVEVALTRDARDSTLGIDLDQFSGKPTVAVVVPGGPAERDGLVRAGDIILAVDGVNCQSITEVMEVLCSPAAMKKNPLHFTFLRMAKYSVVDDVLLVRAYSLVNASDGMAGICGGGTYDSDGKYGASAHAVGGKNSRLYTLTSWTECRCTLRSDRRLFITERSIGVNAVFDIRATDSVHLVLAAAEEGGPVNRSCLQVRTGDGLVELCARGGGANASSLMNWQYPLEEMLMVSLAPVCRGWFYNLTTPASDGIKHRRTFLDLNHHAQLRTMMDQPWAERASKVGVVELAGLEGARVISVDEPMSSAPALADTRRVLQLTSSESTCLLACDDSTLLEEWAVELSKAHRKSLVALVEYTGMILLDGWLDYQGDEDEWASGFFVLTIGSGLQCFDEETNDPKDIDAIETIPLAQITGGVRSKGMDYYDWCIDVSTSDGDYIRVRPQSQPEMTRWLATMNLYCSSPAKRKSERPLRRATPDEAEASAAGGEAAASGGLATMPSTAANVPERPPRNSKESSSNGEANPKPPVLAPRQQRRSLSFTRRRDAEQRQSGDAAQRKAVQSALPVSAVSTRGGRLKSKKASAPAAAPSRLGAMRRPSFSRRRTGGASAATPAAAPAPAADGGSQPAPPQIKTRALSYGRRRAKSSYSVMGGVPAAADPHLKLPGAEGFFEDAVMAPPPLQQVGTNGEPIQTQAARPVTRRAFSFGRRRGRSASMAAPAAAEAQYTAAPAPAPAPASAKMASALWDEPLQPVIHVQQEPVVPVPSQPAKSLGRTLARRAASFGTRRGRAAEKRTNSMYE